ncbi:MAG TPA: DUF1343 domain-containing protein [Gemmatimonadaceae bacterium]|nr:DUF1343 domain-containing protein [Gemmatimonadaceae bacterium]
MSAARPVALAALLLSWSLACAQPAESSAAATQTAEASDSLELTVRPGVELLADSLPAAIRGKRLGLITNHTGRDRAGRSTIDVLAAIPGVRLVALFGPEHGIRGEAAPGEKVESGRDAATGLPVHSLYGATQKPTPAMLRGVDALVFDIQDVGARPYTYVYTMALAMKAAAERRMPFVVLDRPNPIGGTMVEGNVLDTAFASFVGMYPIPERHGMTVGELARLFNAEYGLGAELYVIPAAGWRRTTWYDQTGMPWVAPSPNIKRLEAAIHYPGTVFFEGTNLSEGRGSEFAFEQTGAPWLRADSVVAVMNAMRLPGVRFEAVRFTPVATAVKFPGKELPGVRLVVTDRAVYQPVRASLLLIDAIRRLHPGDFQFTGQSKQNPRIYWLDRLAGTDKVRLAMEAGTLPALLAGWDADEAGFRALRQPYLLYP